ncbi:MAG: GntR family transcriptional regulator, partial [bacterium]
MLQIIYDERGITLRDYTFARARDMFEIRKNLESLAVEVAIDRMDEIHLAKIKDIYELMEFYTGKKDAKKLGELNIMFHESIYQATQSAYFIQILTDMHYYVSMVSAHCIEQEERLESSLQEHHEILRCIEIGDKHGAIDTIHRHISKSQILVRNYYKTRNQKER